MAFYSILEPIKVKKNEGWIAISDQTNQFSEASIIKLLQDKFHSIGDDAAILPINKTRSYVITKDLLVEDLHFKLNYQDGSSLARKALQVNLSDLAAMGATPHSVLLGISIPNQKQYYDYLNSFLQCFVWACLKQNIKLIGGDTTGSSDKFFISVTAIGTALNKNIKYRHTAEEGDLIYVAGSLGEAHIGLVSCEKALSNQIVRKFYRQYTEPMAKLAEGAWFGTQKAVTAMMDISDGLYIDLKKLCQSSKLAASLDLDQLAARSFSKPEFKPACKILNLDRTIIKLIGGEDYALLLTVQSDKALTLEKKFYEIFGYELQPIGKMKRGKGVQFIKNKKPVHLDLKPFTHFGET